MQGVLSSAAAMRHKVFSALLAMLAASLLLLACGNEEQAGVSLQPVGQYPTLTATLPPTSTPPGGTPTPGSEGVLPAGFSASGRLLLLRGGQFLLYDLVSGQITPLEGPRAYSPAVLSADATRGAFVTFPHFGIFDLVSGEMHTIRNTGSIPTGLSLSPDGNWLATLTGTITVSLRLINTRDGSTYNVASSSQHPIAWAWTADGRLAWWWNDTLPPEPQVFDLTTRASIPLREISTTLVVPPSAALSPDGTRAAIVPVARGPNQPESCFDSYVGLLDVPFATPQSMDTTGTAVWTEPGLVASSPQWLDSDTLLFVKLGIGSCGQVNDSALSRQIMMLELAGGTPRPLAGPLGNADDPNDRAQQFGSQVSHLYSPSPDGAYVAWIGGGMEQGESLLNVTEVASGQTAVLLRLTRADAQDMADFIENGLLRQVVWLP